MPPPPKPKPKPRKPKPKPNTGPADAKKPMPRREPERDATPAPGGGGVPILQPRIACETYGLCPPPPGPPATLHLRSSHLPTPLIIVSASLLALSAVLLLALLVRWLVRRRRRGQEHALQEAPLAQEEDDEESVYGVDSTAGGFGAGEEEEVDSGDGDGVHHVWFIRTKGLDERAIAAIAAVVYDASSKTKRVDDGGCAVCLAEFRDGETLRLLPRCGHAFHRACIDTWLRAHVNCPLCRAPVQVPAAAAGDKRSAATAAWVHGQAEADRGGARTEETERGGVVVAPPDRAVRRAASMVTIPRRAWPDLTVQAPASSSGREEDMSGLAKIRRLLKLSEAGVGSVSFGAGRCHSWPTRSSGSSTAAGDVIELSR